MSPFVETVTREELESRRAQLVAEVRMTAAELRELDRTHTLSPLQRDALWELDEIEFLLGES